MEVNAFTVHTPGDRETAQASMLDWYEALKYLNPARILFLGQKKNI